MKINIYIPYIHNIITRKLITKTKVCYINHVKTLIIQTHVILNRFTDSGLRHLNALL